MKRHTSFLLMLASLAFLLALNPMVAHAEPAQDAEGEEAEVPEAYVGQLPDNDKLEVLAEHKVIAVFQGQKFRRCMGKTGNCTDKCGSSGLFANFKITDYLHYKKDGKYGDDKQSAYMVQTSDFHREPKGDPALLAYIELLEEGDLVLIEWKHLYGEVRPGASSPVRPLLLLKKIDKQEAKVLKEQAEAEAEQADDKAS